MLIWVKMTEVANRGKQNRGGGVNDAKTEILILC